MQAIVSKELCTGCLACYNSCPKDCIKILKDKDGFWYTEIDDLQCINCGICKKSCPILNDSIIKREETTKAYACINKDVEEKHQSSSGGVFSVVAKKILNSGGIVYGAAFDDKLNVNHIAVYTLDELENLRGSKYVQSDINTTYTQVKENLTSGKTVLFSGTPCQISGLYCYLGKAYDNLYTQDIICHGVPSPKIWQLYVEYIENKLKTKVNRNIKPRFRDKNEGWKRFSFKMLFENNTQILEFHQDNIYMKTFLKNLSLRECCYNCRYKTIKRESDITLADFWGAEHIVGDFVDYMGTSLVLLHSDKARVLFDSIKSDISYKEVNVTNAVKYNSATCKSVKKPKKRELFLERVTSENFEQIVDKCTKVSLSTKLFNIAKIGAYKVLSHFKKYINKR